MMESVTKEREPLKLIPLSELKKVLTEIVNAPPEKVERAKTKTKKKT
jgi:hypothetical protein